MPPHWPTTATGCLFAVKLVKSFGRSVVFRYLCKMINDGNTMSTVEIRKVTTKKELDAFIQLHYDLYKDNEYDAPNLYSDELHTLRKDCNAAFEFCEAEYFLAYKDGRLVDYHVIFSYWKKWMPMEKKFQDLSALGERAYQFKKD